MPNPLSPLYHYMPVWFHTLGTLVNHVVELPAPFMMLMSRNVRVVGGIIQIGFQVREGLVASRADWRDDVVIRHCDFSFSCS